MGSRAVPKPWSTPDALVMATPLDRMLPETSSPPPPLEIARDFQGIGLDAARDLQSGRGGIGDFERNGVDELAHHIPRRGLRSG